MKIVFSIAKSFPRPSPGFHSLLKVQIIMIASMPSMLYTTSNAHANLITSCSLMIFTSELIQSRLKNQAIVDWENFSKCMMRLVVS